MVIACFALLFSKLFFNFVASHAKFNIVGLAVIFSLLYSEIIYQIIHELCYLPTLPAIFDALILSILYVSTVTVKFPRITICILRALIASFTLFHRVKYIIQDGVILLLRVSSLNCSRLIITEWVILHSCNEYHKEPS